MTPLSSIEGPDTMPEEQRQHSTVAPKHLLCLPSMTEEMLQTVLEHLASVFAADDVLVMSPDFRGNRENYPLPVAAYELPREQSQWVLTAGDYLAATAQAQQYETASVILLGPDAASLPAECLREMTGLLDSGADLVVPTYSLKPHEGLVNAALLYPLTRALFNTNIRFPLASDAGMSRRMAVRLSSSAQRRANLPQSGPFLWPVAEAAATAFTVRQVDAGTRSITPPDDHDFNALFTEIAASLFADIEAKASFWQRTRPPAAQARAAESSSRAVGTGDGELPAMVDAFRLAHNNLQEIWSLVLPPQSLLALKKLSLSEPAEFSLAPGLWARIVYDFALAFHMRTLNRNHLLGALTPLYLAWVASMIRGLGDNNNDSAHTQRVEDTAIAFEREKPYLVARWRWPDRFNP